MNDQDEASAIHEHLRDVPIRERDRADDSPDFENVEAEAAFWRAQFERERERLVKLWVAYKDLEAALELRKNETGAVAERKVAARLSEGNQREGEAIRVDCEDSERAVEAGRGTSYKLEIENVGATACTVHLDVSEVEEDWNALTSFSQLELEPDETRQLYLLVRSSQDADPDDFCVVTLDVTTGEGAKRQVRTFTTVQPARQDTGEESLSETEESETAADGSLLDPEPLDRDTLIRRACETLLDELDADLVTAYEVHDDRLELSTVAGIEEPEPSRA